MRIHILGICGTFMGGLALIAKQLGYQVTGSDVNVYPPMSTLLHDAGIEIYSGYDPKHLQPDPGVVIIGNTLSRGNPAVEYVLNHSLDYQSGPQWLAEKILANRHVLAVSGTHGKTTVASLLTWILQVAGLKPGYLIGGVPQNFEQSADMGEKPYFVIEADEYDSAFFDKRSKFMHYHPKTLIINNIEFDHADIFASIEAIKKQFQYLIRTVPGAGTIIYPEQDSEIQDVLSRGVWSATSTISGSGANWQAKRVSHDGSRFELWHRDQKLGVIAWNLLGQHNVKNALAAIAASHAVGVPIDKALLACRTFKGVKRRLEICGTTNDITVYDDFAHHPTAIASTIAGLRAKVGRERIVVVLEFASNSMRMGAHRNQIAKALKSADEIVLLKPNHAEWDVKRLLTELGKRASLHNQVNDVLQFLENKLKPKDHVLIMSNKGFEGIHQRLLTNLQKNNIG